MLLVYMTLTGNVREFVDKTDFDSIELDPSDPFIEVNEDYIVVVPSYVGEIDDEVSDFIDYKDNRRYLKGFAASGNLNFDDLYCVNGKSLSKKYNEPLIFTFEYSGTETDVENFEKEVKRIEVT